MFLSKRLVLAAALVGAITLAGCGTSSTGDTTKNEEVTQIYNVGDTISTEVFDCTLTNLEFVDAVNATQGDDFFNPASEGLIGADGYHLLQFAFDYTYTGKSSLNSSVLEDAQFIPSVTYQDYDIDSNYFVFWRTKGGEWYNYASDVPWAARQNMGLALPDLTYSYEPLEDKTYEVRGVISVPDKAYNDEASPMTISFQLLTSVEDTNYNYNKYTFNVR